MATSMLMQHFRHSLLRLERRLLELFGHRGHGNELHPALAVAGLPCHTPQNQTESPRSLLDSVLGGSIVWASVPKFRRSLERRMTRRMQHRKHYEHAMPKKNIIACLDCGNWHERHSLCGHCYDKVRQETKEMMSTMPEDDRFYNAPQKEVIYLYEDEIDGREKYKDRYIVEMPKKKPEWWPKYMLTKSRT